MSMPRSVLRDILSTMEDDCKRYAIIDTKNIISKTAVVSYRFTSIVAFCYLVSTTFYTIGTFAALQTNDTMSRQLLFKMDLPFDTTESPAYELMVTAQILQLAAMAFTFGIFSSLLLMVTFHVGCHIDILCQRMGDTSDILDKEQIRFFLNRQQEITVFVEKVEQLFTYIALSQLLSNTINICCLGYLIIISLHDENGLPILLKSVIFYNVVCLEAFIYCFVGEFLDIKSKMIAEAAYEVPWYNLQPSVSRLLVLLILRAQKGLPLTFGKFSNLNLESFTGIMKASASYMSVLLAIS